MADVTSDINALAAKFAAKYGSFSLEFDAEQNYLRSDDLPWVVVVSDDVLPDHASVQAYTKGYAGLTAEEALAFADAELAPRPEAVSDV